MYRKGLFSTQNIQAKTLSIPIHVSCEQDLRSLFKPTIDHLKLISDTREKEDFTSSYTLYTGHQNLSESVEEQYKQVGAKIKIKWDESEVAGIGWKPGWFTAIVQQYCHATDTLTLTYSSEPGRVYEEDLTYLMSNNRIKLPCLKNTTKPCAHIVINSISG